MTERELLELLLQKVSGIETRLDKIEIKIDIGFKNTKEASDALLGLVEETYHETEKIGTTQSVQLEMLRNLAADTAQHEAEISLLKRAK